MSSYEHVAEQTHLETLPGLAQDFFDGGIVGRLGKQRRPTHGPIENVEDIAAISTSQSSRHGLSIAAELRLVNKLTFYDEPIVKLRFPI
jgi:hypothetical protein